MKILDDFHYFVHKMEIIPGIKKPHPFENELNAERFTVSHSLAGLWQNRSLLLVMAKRETAIRYANTRLGLSWSLLRLIITMTLYFYVFLFVFKHKDPHLPYILILTTGLLVWQPFIETLNSAGRAVQYDLDLMKKILLPRMAFPLYRSLMGVVDIAIVLVFITGASLYHGNHFWASYSLLLLPFLIIYQLFLVFSIALCTNVLLVLRPDWNHLFFTLIGYLAWATPVFYTQDMVPAFFKPLLIFNPAASIIHLYRHILLNQPLQTLYWLPGLLVTICIFIAGIHIFHRYQDQFTERM